MLLLFDERVFSAGALDKGGSGRVLGGRSIDYIHIAATCPTSTVAFVIREWTTTPLFALSNEFGTRPLGSMADREREHLWLLVPASTSMHIFRVR